MYQVFIRIYKYTIYIITEILLVSETMSDQLRYTLAHNGSDLLQYGMTITRFWPCGRQGKSMMGMISGALYSERYWVTLYLELKGLE